MRLVTFVASGEARAGALLDAGIVDLNRADPELPPSVLGLIQGGPGTIERARRAAQQADSTSAVIQPLDSVKLLAPIPRPPKIVCIGVNYADHAAEAGRGLPPKPSVFLKAPSCVVGVIMRPSNFVCPSLPKAF